MDTNEMTVSIGIWTSLQELCSTVPAPAYTCTVQLEGRDDFSLVEESGILRDKLIAWAQQWVQFGAKVTIQEHKYFT